MIFFLFKILFEALYLLLLFLLLRFGLMCFSKVFKFRSAFAAVEKSVESLTARRGCRGFRLQSRNFFFIYFLLFHLFRFWYSLFCTFRYFRGFLVRLCSRCCSILHRFLLLYSRGFDKFFRLLLCLLLRLLIALIEAYIALLFRIFFLDFVQFSFAGFKALKLKTEDIANERLHVDFHLKKGHLETFRCQRRQRMLYNFD